MTENVQKYAKIGVKKWPILRKNPILFHKIFGVPLNEKGPIVAQSNGNYLI